ncbi:MAG: 5-formyltetrahydrofolate cyclo-ligase [Marinilabiliales bacterium]|nr:MAG: 5-formyltetrahydrofolate cyclo-ligase [Marinilabiliales bacterium]
MINEQKKNIRKEITEKKSLISLEEKKAKSKILFNKIEKIPEFQNSKVVMAYWSMPDEVFTHDFVLKWFNEKIIILPVVTGSELELKVFSGLQNMRIGEAYGIEEPIGVSFTRFNEIDMIIVPGVAFDKNNNRLGRGKAYYDKILNKTQALKLGICFDFQYLKNVPVDQHDVKMDMVMYE